ncbi:short-chain dehydrogenase/reductase [Sinomonas cyclohexanicum]|uniref:Short-chain dehydrogenase/reductase n=1 Tax=Sinomonas cyclohexanicum TaxID=322009 RepID=A0ABM7PQD4_SINCY|nr:oxidoreductase [Corynebacterium cyclohexanicum]BCT74260.1 short-chain dehydrogenase/reductase [Corynebacterium cyclohexanicum]
MQQVALVTGASSGIGEATVRALLGVGYTVYAAARRVERMEALAHDGARLLALDVTDDPSLTDGVRKVLAEAGRIDVLVNNAGYGSYGSLEEVPLEEGRRQFEVNVFGLARLTQLVLPGMRERRSGTIVNVSSMGGQFYEPLGSWYHATKFAVEGLSDSLRIELRPFGVRVIVIQPGSIRTEWSGIAREGLLATSGSGPYAKNARRVAGVMKMADRRGMGSSPDVVARAIVEAVRSPRPAPRYRAGAGAKPLLALRKVLPDRAYDLLVRAIYRH